MNFAVMLHCAVAPVQGVMFPAMHAMLGQWAPPMERSFLGSMVVAGQSVYTRRFRKKNIHSYYWL